MGSKRRRNGPPDWAKSAALAVLAVLVVVGSVAALRQGNASGSAAAETSLPSPSPDPTHALFIGDSYTAGAGASSPQRGEACLTATAMNWTCALDAEGGTGFVADGHQNSASFAPIGKRLPRTIAGYSRVNVVLIDAGRNDGTASDAVKAAAARDFDRISAGWPNVRVVIIAPYFLRSSVGDMQSLRSWLRDQAEARHWYFIDPLAEGWVSTLRNDVIADKVHPNQRGHRLIAEHLAADLRRLGVA